jgi:hypothetical protein
MFSVLLRVFVSWVTPYRCVMGLRTSNTSGVFRFNIIRSQYLRICLNMCTALSIALASTDREFFSLTRIFIFHPFVTFYLVFLCHLFYSPVQILPNESVTLLCISLKPHYFDFGIIL